MKNRTASWCVGGGFNRIEARRRLLSLALVLGVASAAGCTDGPSSSNEGASGVTRTTSAVAITTNFSTTLTASSPTFIRPILGPAGTELYTGNITTFHAGSASFKYSVQPFNVSVSGNYDIQVTGGAVSDSVIYIYSPSFNAASPLTNLLVGNDDQNTTLFSKLTAYPLTAGTSYTLVVTTYDPSESGTIQFSGTGAGGLSVATASSLSVTGATSPTTACSSNAVTVTAKDSGGATATSYRGTVHFTSSDTQATLPADYTFVAGDNGVHTFSGVSLKTAGSQSITATDSGFSFTASQTGITVQASTVAAISVNAGSPQSATVGAMFATSLKAKVVDGCGTGNGVSGVSVSFSPTGSGPSATITGSPATTNGSGIATVTAVANTVPGSYSISATASGAGSAATFSLTNNIGPAAIVTATGGSGQSAALGQGFTTPLSVSVTDAYGNTITGASVSFTAPGSGASATITGSPATTDATGAAALMAAANAISGTYDVTASVSGAGTSATFSLTNQNGASIAPTSATVAPRGSQSFMPSGGSGMGYTFTFVTNNSGALLDPMTGIYTAGPMGGTTDTIRVTDSLGTGTNAIVTVSAGVSITPSAPTVAPRGTTALSASGGSGTGFSYALTTNYSGGSIGATTGVYTAGTVGSISDVVTATDSLGNTATVTIAVGAPISISPTSASVAPGALRSFTASGGAGTGYTFTLSTNHSGGSITSGGAYTAGAIGSGSDVVSVTDGLGNSTSASVTVGAGVSITGGAGNSAPRAALDFTATGGSGTGFTFSLVTNGSNGSITAGGHYVAGATASTLDVVRVADSLGNTNTANVVVGPGVSVTPVAPHPAPRASVTLVASGGSGTGYTFTLTTSASGGSVGASTGIYTAGATGNAADIVKVTDSLGNSTTVSISVGGGLAISPAAPTLAPRASQSLTASGGSGTGYMFTFTTNPSGGTIGASSGTYVAGPTGTTTDIVKVTDSLGNTATVPISVTAGLQLTPVTSTLAPLGHLQLVVAGGSGTGYTFALTTNGSDGSVDAGTGRYVAGTTGSTTDVVTASDPLGNTATTTITVTDALVASPATSSIPPRSTVALGVAGGAGGVTFALTTNGSGGMVDGAAGAYTAGSNADSTDVVTATDANGAISTVSMTIGAGVSVSPATPKAAPRGTLTFTATGGSGTGYAFALLTNPSGGAINVSTGVYAAGSVAAVTDVLQVRDLLGNTATVGISVGAALTLNPIVAAVSPRETIALGTAGGSGTGYTYALTTNGSGATIGALNGTYAAGPTPNTTDVVTVTDSIGNTATATLHVGTGLMVTPATLMLAPRGTATLFASGGSGSGYVFTFQSNGSGGTVQNTTGAYHAGPTGSTTDVVVVTDSYGNTATATISVGDAVTLLPAVSTVAPRAHLAFTASGGNGQYTFSLQENGSGGVIDAASGLYTAGAISGAVDTIAVVDSLGDGASLSVSVGAGISLQPATPSVAPGGKLTFLATGGSGTGYVFALTGNASGGSIDAATGTYKAGSTGNVEDVVTVTDSTGNTLSLGISVGNGIVLAPLASSVSPRGHLTFSAHGGGSTYAFSLAANASGATIDAATGAYTAGERTNVTDIVRVADELGNSATASVAVGAAPGLTPAHSDIAPLGTITFAVTGGAGKGYVYTLTTNASGGTVGLDDGRYTAGPVGGVIDVVTVTDALGNVDTAEVRVGPALSALVVATSVAPRGSATIIAMDGAGAYTFALATNASGGSINGASGLYTAGATGSVNDVIAVTDGNGATVTLTLHVGPSLSVTPGTPAMLVGQMQQFVATGGSGEGYVFHLLAAPSGGSVEASTGMYHAGNVAPATDVLEVRDSLGNTLLVSISVAAGDGTTPHKVSSDSSCACSTSAGFGPTTGGGAALLIALGLVLRPRRRRDGRP